MPPLIASLVVTKSRVTRSGVAAWRLLSNAVLIDPGAARYGSELSICPLNNKGHGAPSPSQYVSQSLVVGPYS